MEWIAAREEWIDTHIRFHTRKSYRSHLLHFERWHRASKKGEASFATISATTCRQYQRFLLQAYGRGRFEEDYVLDRATAKSKFSALSSFLQFAVNHGYLPRNFAAAAPKLRVSSEQRPSLAKEELSALVGAAYAWMFEDRENPEQSKLVDFMHQRDIYRAMMAGCAIRVLAHTGCRVGELVGLRKEDLIDSPQGKRLRFLAKGGKVHAPIAHPEAIEAFLEAAQLSKAKRETDVVFRNQLGRPANAAWVNTLLTELCKRACVRRITCHSVRSSVATTLHRDGVPIVEIKNLLGHASIETTSRYIRFADEAKHAAGLKIALF